MAVLGLMAGLVCPVAASPGRSDGFDNPRQAPSVEFLDGNALDLLVGSRDASSLADDAPASGTGIADDLPAGKELADLLVDGQGEFDLEHVSWKDAESEPAPEPVAGEVDPGTIGETLDLEDLELPGEQHPQTEEAAPPGSEGPSGGGV